MVFFLISGYKGDKYEIIFLFFLRKSNDIYSEMRKEEEAAFFGGIIGIVIMSIITSSLFGLFLIVVTSESFEGVYEGSSYLLTYYFILNLVLMSTVLIIDRICSSLDKKTDNIKNNVISINSNRKEG